MFQDTQACIAWMYGRMEYGCRKYPGFFMLHSLGFMQEDKFDGKRRMQQTYLFLKSFDGKAFAIMAVMMTGGIGLRASGLAPERFIAVFYTGLGASLLVPGLLFGRNYGRAVLPLPCTVWPVCVLRCA